MLNKIKFFLGLTNRIVAIKCRNGDYIIYDNHNKILKAPYVTSEVDFDLRIFGQPLLDKIQIGKIKYADRTGYVSPDEVYVAQLLSIPLNLVFKDCDSLKDKEAFFVKDAYFHTAKKIKYGYIIDGKEIKELLKQEKQKVNNS